MYQTEIMGGPLQDTPITPDVACRPKTIAFMEGSTVWRYYTSMEEITTRSLKSYADVSQIIGSDEKKTHRAVRIAKKIFIPIDEELVRAGIADGTIPSGMIDEVGRLVFQKRTAEQI